MNSEYQLRRYPRLRFIWQFVGTPQTFVWFKNGVNSEVCANIDLKKVDASLWN
jgi:hypothetical protein